MAKHFWLPLPLLAVSLLAAGCSSGSDGSGTADCSFTSCGGDPVGSWDLIGTCLSDGLETFEECASSTTEHTVHGTGTITFGADGSFAERLHFEGKYHLRMDDACASATFGGDVHVSAAQLCIELGSRPLPPPYGCTLEAGFCTCDLPFDGETEEAGEYEIRDHTIEVTTVDGDFDYEFCVDGDELRLRDWTDIYVLRRAP